MSRLLIALALVAAIACFPILTCLPKKDQWVDSPGVIAFRRENLAMAQRQGWILSWEQTGVKTGRVLIGPNFANLKTGSERYVYTWVHQELFPAEVLDREAVLEIVGPNGERIGVFP